LSGQLVVNELESLEAEYYSRREKETYQCDVFLTGYWEVKINEYFYAQHLQHNKF
jgi:hypothetical protein